MNRIALTDSGHEKMAKVKKRLRPNAKTRLDETGFCETVNRILGSDLVPDDVILEAL